MANELAALASWTFFQEVAIPQDIGALMVNGEQPIAAYKTIRDVAVFTNKRLIVKDAQGITGKKIEIYSLPYSSITMNLKKGIDIRKFDTILAMAIL